MSVNSVLIIDRLDNINETLGKINDNLVALSITLSRNSGSKPAPVSTGHPPDSGMSGLEYRRAVAMEQRRRSGEGEQVGAVRVASAPEPSRKPEAPTWGLEVGSASLVLDTNADE